MKHLLTGISLAALAITISVPVLADEDVCLSSAEAEAHKVRHLQTQLMIGALQCQDADNLGQRANYNGFVTKYRGSLKRYGTDLIGFFRRNHASAYRTALDRHITELANRISLESQRIDDFCHQIAAVGELLVGDSSVAITEAVNLAPIGYRPLARQCGHSNSQTATVD